MKPNQKQMIADFVKAGRQAKGYTQKELSELSNISVRSIQRIENGEIVPRSYTLKTLAHVLGKSMEELQQIESTLQEPIKMNKAQKIVLSIGVPSFILVLSVAFLAQSATFPETHFERFVFYAVVISLMTATVTWIWRTKS